MIYKISDRIAIVSSQLTMGISLCDEFDTTIHGYNLFFFKINVRSVRLEPYPAGRYQYKEIEGCNKHLNHEIKIQHNYLLDLSSFELRILHELNFQ